MNTYKPHRFPSGIISYAVWIYFRFKLSCRDIEDLLAERGMRKNSPVSLGQINGLLGVDFLTDPAD